MTTRIMTAAAIIGARRVLAPAAAFNAEADAEPPTGIPAVSALAALATPWPMKSRDTSGRCPSALAYMAEIPAPCTRPMNASDAAGKSNMGTCESDGNVH
jgi:hypothetical protein